MAEGIGIQVKDKFCRTIEEAPRYFGIGEKKLRKPADDDSIRKNPFEFQLATVVANDSVTREAITRKQERAFLEFIKGDKHFSQYYDGIYILFRTGLRISEFAGLTWI